MRWSSMGSDPGPSSAALSSDPRHKAAASPVQMSQLMLTSLQSPQRGKACSVPASASVCPKTLCSVFLCLCLPVDNFKNYRLGFVRKNAPEEFSWRTPDGELMPLRGTSFTYCQNLWYVASRLLREGKNRIGWMCQSILCRTGRCCNASIQAVRQREERGDYDACYCERHKYNRFVKVWLIKLSAPQENVALMQPFNLFFVFSRLFLFLRLTSTAESQSLRSERAHAPTVKTPDKHFFCTRGFVLVNMDEFSKHCRWCHRGKKKKNTSNVSLVFLNVADS